MAAPLLQYSITTTPNPLQVSLSATELSKGILTIVISNPNGANGPVWVEKILFGFPVGDQSFALTNDSGAIVPQTGTSTAWQITQASPGNFNAAPANQDSIEIGDEGVVLQLTQIPINEEVGTVTLSIAEFSSPTSDSFTRKDTSSQVGKFPYGFYMRDFISNVPDVQDGGTATLTWQGSDQARYFIQYDQSLPKVEVTEQRSWTSPALHNDTTFILEAVVTGANNESVSSFLSTTVIVDNPEVSATSLEVAGTSTLKGATTVGVQGGPSANLQVNGSAVVTGTLAVSSATTLSGAASVLGQLSAATGLNLTGALNLQSGGNTVASINASGAASLTGLTVNGPVNINGPLNMMQVQNLQGSSITRTAAADGLAIAIMVPNGNADKKSAGWVTVSSPLGTQKAFGGNLAGPDKSYYAVPGYLLVPIEKGWQVTWNYSFAGENDTFPTAFFFWAEYGVTPTLMKRELVPTPAVEPSHVDYLPRQTEAVIEKAQGFASVLETLLPAPLDMDRRQALVMSILELVRAAK